MARHRKREADVCVLIATSCFLVCAASSFKLWRATVGTRDIREVKVEIPQEPSYLAYDQEELDLPILYYGFDAQSIAELKEADVLFLGTSRDLFLCRRELLHPFFMKHRLKYFVLAFANFESGVVPLEIIQRYDLHPKLVVIDVCRFFSRPRSLWATKIVNEGRWSARKLVLESNAAFWSQRYLHQVIPRWPEESNVLDGIVCLTAFRSRESGEWDIRFTGKPRKLPPKAPDRPITVPDFNALAEKYHAEKAARGFEVVFQLPPEELMDDREAIGAGAMLNAPLLRPPPAEYTTLDGYHLTAESAERYLTALLSELEKTPAFQHISNSRP